MNARSFELADSLAEHGRYRSAFRVFLRAGQRGDTSVFGRLGYAYDVGQGVRKSRRKALYWYRRALAAGEAVAAHNIGTVYRDSGHSLRAAAWFRRAVALGLHGSNLELGQLLLGGLGQPADALACFRAIGSKDCDAVVEAAKTWSAVTEGILA